MFFHSSRAVTVAVAIATGSICTAVNAESFLSPSQVNNPWFAAGENAVYDKISTRFGVRAKNVILFVGDGMGISTLTAARILEGQLDGMPGEENFLSFEKFPTARW